MIIKISAFVGIKDGDVDHVGNVDKYVNKIK